jgi:hypothetical protein
LSVKAGDEITLKAQKSVAVNKTMTSTLHRAIKKLKDDTKSKEEDSIFNPNGCTNPANAL